VGVVFYLDSSHRISVARLSCDKRNEPGPFLMPDCSAFLGHRSLDAGIWAQAFGRRQKKTGYSIGPKIGIDFRADA